MKELREVISDPYGRRSVLYCGPESGHKLFLGRVYTVTSRDIASGEKVLP
jgi:hypothetical protein